MNRDRTDGIANDIKMAKKNHTTNSQEEKNEKAFHSNYEKNNAQQ